jgi:glutamate transport system ATP-binding protein
MAADTDLASWQSCRDLPQGQAPAPLISMRNVGKRFGLTKALHQIDLDIARGEVMVLLGRSGSGKSTLCRTINRLETVSEGEIFFRGAPLPQEGAALKQLRADIGMVFQSFNLFPHMTALENVAFAPMRIRKRGRAAAESKARDFLDRVGLGDKAAAYPAQLSGGQQQRIAIARSLAMEPEVMLFDDPTSALDPEMVCEVLEMMARLAKEGMTMVAVTHEIDFVRATADHVVLLADGSIAEQGPPSNFFDNPQSTHAKEFLARTRRH